MNAELARPALWSGFVFYTSYNITFITFDFSGKIYVPAAWMALGSEVKGLGTKREARGDDKSDRPDKSNPSSIFQKLCSEILQGSQ